MTDVSSIISGCWNSPTLIKLHSAPTEKLCSRAHQDGRSASLDKTTKQRHSASPTPEDLPANDKRPSVHSGDGRSSKLKPGLY